MNTDANQLMDVDTKNSLKKFNVKFIQKGMVW